MYVYVKNLTEKGGVGALGPLPAPFYISLIVSLINMKFDLVKGHDFTTKIMRVMIDMKDLVTST